MNCINQILKNKIQLKQIIFYHKISVVHWCKITAQQSDFAADAAQSNSEQFTYAVAEIANDDDSDASPNN